MHRGSNFNRGGPTPPVQVGEELDVTIEAVGAKGDGIAKKNGFVLFIPNVKEGEHVRIKVTKVLQKVGFAEKVGDAQAPPASEPAAQEDSFEPAPEPEQQPVEDTEDFGEEPAEEPEAQEKPAAEEPEEPAPAEPAAEEPAEPEEKPEGQ